MSDATNRWGHLQSVKLTTFAGAGYPTVQLWNTPPGIPSLGWQCPGCGACFAPGVVACLRCTGTSERARNPLVDIVISAPAEGEAG